MQPTRAHAPLPCAGTYVDKKCPFTGNGSIRGRILTGAQQLCNQAVHAALLLNSLLLHAGIVKSTKMNRTIVVRRDYLHYVKKYARSVPWLSLPTNPQPPAHLRL
jgi:hypothetical protein